MDPAAEPQGANERAGAGPGETDSSDIEKNKDIAAFSYLWVMSVFVYFLRRNSAFVRYHSKQAMLLFAISIPLWMVPFIGNFLELIILAGMILGFMHAAQGQYKDVPLAGPLSRGEMSLREAWQLIVDFIAKLGKTAGDTFHSEKKESKEQSPSSPAPLPPPRNEA